MQCQQKHIAVIATRELDGDRVNRLEETYFTITTKVRFCVRYTYFYTNKTELDEFDVTNIRGWWPVKMMVRSSFAGSKI